MDEKLCSEDSRDNDGSGRKGGRDSGILLSRALRDPGSGIQADDEHLTRGVVSSYPLDVFLERRRGNPKSRGDASKLSVNRALKSKLSSFRQSHTDHIKAAWGDSLTRGQAGSGTHYQTLFQDIRSQNQSEERRQRGGRT